MVQIREVSPVERTRLTAILERSFEGIYLRHAKRTLTEVKTVRGAFVDDEPVGLSMLKILRQEAGYVYYIAVSPEHRRMGVGASLLDDAVSIFFSMGVKEVYASVGETNMQSNALFRGKGFRRTSYGKVSRKYGLFRAIAMYRAMLVVPGEVLLVLDGPSLMASIDDQGSVASSS